MMAIIKTYSKLVSFELTPHRHLLVLYSPSLPQSRKLNMMISFNSTQIVLDNEYADTVLYLDKALKYSVSRDDIEV